MLFNRADILDAASRRIAPAPTATPGERAAIDAEMFAETSMSLSAQADMERVTLPPVKLRKISWRTFPLRPHPTRLAGEAEEHGDDSANKRTAVEAA